MKNIKKDEEREVNMKKEVTFEEFLEHAKPFAERIQAIGGESFVVGGCVRDHLNGIHYPKDYDILVTGITKEQFHQLFPHAPFVGDEEDGFPVFLVEIAGEMCEVAFARKEKKIGEGYKGFETYTDPSLTIFDDLVRRDLTINAMAVHLLTHELFDPYNGQSDLKNGIIRHISPAFAEDPLRVLRAARFAARYGFVIHETTLHYMKSLRDELVTFKPERVFEETKKALSGQKPSVYFQTLADIGVLDVHYPELHRLIGVPQPVKYHPEGDCFTHSMLVLDAMAKQTDSLEERFAALVHDLGKGDSPSKWEKQPELHPYESHYGHEELGVPHVKRLCERLKLPKTWMKAGMFGAEFHGTMHKLGQIKSTKSLRKVIKLIEEAKRNPLGVEGMARLALSDTRGKGNEQAEHPYTEFWLTVAPLVLSVKADASLPIDALKEDKVRRQIHLYKTIKKDMGV